MRRVLFTMAASIALVSFIPASAMARSHHRHHRRHHTVRRHTHTFGHFMGINRLGTRDTPSSSSTAGTVTSWDPTSGQLTITLNDGTTTETAMVTGDTEIECLASGQAAGGDDQGDQSGDDQGDQSGGDDQGDQSGDDQGDQSAGDDQGEDDQGDQAQNCSSANLAVGVVVLGAELRITGDGPVWENLEVQS
jgi:hypothetical protein